jgi:hypothetical protein
MLKVCFTVDGIAELSRRTMIDKIAILFLYIDKNELITFKDCIKTIMIHLRRLHFILYLPVQTRLDDIDLYWFNLDHHTVEYQINEVIFLYTIPYLLNNQRRVYNNSVAQQSTINNNITHIEWIIDHDLFSIAKTLLHFEHVKSLHLFFNMTVNIQYEFIQILYRNISFRK